MTPLRARRALAALVVVALGACVPALAGTASSAPVPTEESYLRARRLMVPVEGVRPEDVPDTYNARRGNRRHGAVDILAPRGTPVLAADDGRVLRVRSNNAGGLVVYAVDPHERFVYYYAHLDAYREGLRDGDVLRKGDVIGYVGTTGNAPPGTPHLHFQLMRYDDPKRYWDGAPIDPRPLFELPGERGR